jgi:hypothetical protein
MRSEDSSPVIFLSHCSEDKEAAERLVRVLEEGLGLHEKGQIVFTSSVARGLAPGDPVADKLISYLGRCLKVIVVLSDNATEAPWVLMEAGAGFFQRKLIPVVVKSSHKVRIQGPLKELNVLSLDSAPEINKLIDQLRTDLGAAPREANQYQEEIDALVNHVESAYRERHIGSLADRWRKSGALSKALLMVMVLLGCLAALRGLLAPITFTGSVVFDADSTPVANATVSLNGQSAVQTDAGGQWHFNLEWLPRSHRFDVKDTKPVVRDPARWFGPTWRQWFGFESPVVQLRLTDQGVRLIGATAVVPSMSVFAAGVPQREQPPILRPVPPAYEYGFWLQSVTVGNIPGFFRKSKRGYFRVFVGDVPVDDDSIRTAPLTLGQTQNRFPVQVNPPSWLPVNEYSTLPYKGIYCRLPNDPVALLRADGRVALRQPVRLQLIGDTGDVLSEFNLKEALEGSMKGSQVTGSAPGYFLWVRPELRLPAAAKFDLQWSPQNWTVPAGAKVPFRVRLERGAMPFDVEVAVGACVPSALKKFPCQRALGLAEAPSLIIVRKDSVGEGLHVTFGPRNGRVALLSKLPDLLGGSVDDADIRVSGQLRR